MNQESLRCLLCRNARCTAACPVGTDIPTSMKLYREGRLEEAGKLLFDNNPMSAVTSVVCDWERFCYGHCILNAKKEPVRWYEIEQEISGSYLLEKARIEIPETESGKSVAIVGAGPAGICAAIWLREKGVAVDIYDAFEKMGGVLRYGIPAFRLDKKYVDAYEKLLQEAGVNFHGRAVLGKDISVNGLKESHDAVLIAAGAWVPGTMRIPGEDNPHVLHALDFLKDPEGFDLGEKVYVVGGGNVAMDACRTAKRLGCDTTVLYRKTFENMPASRIEVEEARADGVAFRVFTTPVEIKEEEGKAYAIVRRCENYFREDGSLATRIIEGTDERLDFDTLVIAVSEKADPSILEGTLISQEKGIFSAGDYSYGPRTVVEAVRSAKETTAAISAWLGL